MGTSETPLYWQVLTQAEKLSPADKLRLLETLAGQLRWQITPPKHHRITEFRGVGRANWDGTDAQAYVNQERDTWDG
jgi:hypothetical protein